MADYRVRFDTIPGADAERIIYELDLLDNRVVSNPPVPLVGAGIDPISIEWHTEGGGGGVYKPILGSSATIDLMLSEDGQYEDFNDAPEYTFEARLSQIDPITNLRTAKWCGFINPIDGVESVNTVPFPISFQATDGLGLLESRSVGDLLDRQTTLITFIQRALLLTGLAVDLYVDSGIRIPDLSTFNPSGVDALIFGTINEWAFYNQDRTEKVTLKEALEIVLTSLSCKLIQANGRWYVFNASLHGGTGSTETTEWTVYTFDASTSPDSFSQTTTTATEALRYNVTGAAGTDLSPVNQDFQLNTRRPYGSIEAVFPTLTSISLNDNNVFNAGFAGWQSYNPLINGVREFAGRTPSIDQTLFRSTADGTFLNGNGSIVTSRNVVSPARAVDNSINVSPTSDIWFLNSTSREISYDRPINVNFDFSFRRQNANADEIVLYYGIKVTFPSTFEHNQFLDFLAINEMETPQRGNGNYLHWDFTQNRWAVPSLDTLGIRDAIGSTLAAQEYQLKAVSSSEPSSFHNESVTTDPINRALTRLSATGVPEGAVVTAFVYYPEAFDLGSSEDDNRLPAASSGNVQVFIDNFDITHELNESDAMPRYELRNLVTGGTDGQYSTSLRYEPGLIGSGTDQVYQRINADEYWKKGQTVADQTTLEQIVLQSRLNDFRGGTSPNGSPFKYYEGTFINRTTTPFTPINKVMIDYRWTDESGSAQTYTETASGIFNGGTWRPRSNDYNMSFYIPNQATDQNSEFTRFNVELVSGPPPDRSSNVDYALNVVLRGISLGEVVFGEVTYNDGDVIPDSIIQNTPNSQLRYSLEPGVVTTRELVFSPAAGLVANHSTTVVRPNTATEVRPRNVTFPTTVTGAGPINGVAVFTNQMGSVVLPISITSPQRDDFDELHIDVPVTAFVPEVAPGIEEVTITINNQVADTANMGTTAFQVSGAGASPGRAGNRRRVEFTVSPTDSNVFEVLPSDVTPDFTSAGVEATRITSTYNEQDLNGATLVSFNYEIPAGGETGVVVTLNGSATPVSTATNPTFDYHVELVESIANLSITSATSVLHRDRVGKIERGEFFIQSGEGYFLRAGEFSQSGTTSRVSGVDFVQVSTTVVKVIYNVTIPGATPPAPNVGSAGNPAEIRIISNGGVIAEPYSFTFVANNLGIEGGSVTFERDETGERDVTGTGTHRIGFSDGVTSFPSFDLRVSSAEGMEFLGTADDPPEDPDDPANEDIDEFLQTSNEIAIDVNEASVINTATGGRVVLDEDLVNVTQASTFLDDGDLVFTIDIDPLFLPRDSSNQLLGGNYVLDVNVQGAATYSGLYTIVPEASMILYSGIQAGLPSRRTASFNVATLPDVGRFEIVSVTPSGHTATIVSGTSTVSVSAPASAGGVGINFTSPDTVVTLRHLDDSSVTAVVTATETLTEETTPATMGSLSTTSSSGSNTITSANGGTLTYNVSGVDGLWEMRFSDSSTLPFAGPGPLNNSIISFSAPSGGSSDIGGTLTYGNNGEYLRQGNRLAYIHLIAAGQTTGSSLATVQLTGAAGPVYGELVITTINRAPTSSDADGLYIQFP